MRKLDLLSFTQVRWKLEAAGFRGISQKGNHAKFIKEEPNGRIRTAILPHFQQLSPSVIESIRLQAGLTPEEFDSL